MIFVTVATHFLGFERLIKEMDRIAAITNEEVIAQVGYTKYIPKNMKFFTFTEEEKLLELYKNSRIIVTHAGAGTLLTIFNYKKPVIVVPRLKHFNEHIDNHQLELAEVMEKQKNVIVVYDIKTLEDALIRVEKLNYDEFKQNDTLVLFLKKTIQEMMNG